MATLDVSFVLDCPEFVTTILIRRAGVYATEQGTATADFSWVPIAAVVIPDGGDNLIQTAEGDAVSGDITIYARRDLTQGGKEIAADLIRWDGSTYKVLGSQTYRYGSGFTKVICKQLENNPSLLDDQGCEQEPNALDPE